MLGNKPHPSIAQAAIAGDIAPPEQAPNAVQRRTTAAAITKWESQNVLARPALLACLEPAELTKVYRIKSSHDIWQRLSDEYGAISHTRLHMLRQPSIPSKNNLRRHCKTTSINSPNCSKKLTIIVVQTLRFPPFKSTLLSPILLVMIGKVFKNPWATRSIPSNLQPSLLKSSHSIHQLMNQTSCPKCTSHQKAHSSINVELGKSPRNHTPTPTSPMIALNSAVTASAMAMTSENV